MDKKILKEMVSDLEGAEVYVPDTSVVIEGILSHLIKKKKFKGKIIIHNAVIAELEHQANNNQPIGFLGLEEVKKLNDYAEKDRIEIEYDGARPTGAQIKYAKEGEIDRMIRDLAGERNATLITADRVQAEVAEVMGIKNQLIEFSKEIKGIKIEKFFTKNTMSVHLKENTVPRAKKGSPGKWEFVNIGKKKLTGEEVEEFAKDIIEKTKIDKDSFIEIKRKSSTILQFRNYRTIIARPPLSDGWEITSVRPVKKLSLKDYNLKEDLMNRLKEKAEGILVAGAPGNGKSTFCQALGEFYQTFNKNIKTIEAPRDLILPDEITQYSKNRASHTELHDILLLGRPDYTIFDEIRNTADFNLFKDMRLSGVGMIGVVHATGPIDSIQRFIGRVELGMVPSIIDTVIFINNGKVSRVLELKMTVKVPSGMTEADLARPVVEVRDFETKELTNEIYVFGEETVVIPVSEKKREKTGIAKIAEVTIKEMIKNELKKKVKNIHVDVTSQNSADVFLSREMIPKIIGRGGKRIDKIEKRIGVRINIRKLDELSKEKKKEQQERIPYNIRFSKSSIIFIFSSELSSRSVDFYTEGEFLFTGTISKKGEVRISIDSDLGKKLREATMENKNIKVLL